MNKHELAFLLSRRTVLDEIRAFYGNRSRNVMECDREGWQYKSTFKHNDELSSKPYEGHGKSVFRKIAEFRAVNDAVANEAGYYHWEVSK